VSVNPSVSFPFVSSISLSFFRLFLDTVSLDPRQAMEIDLQETQDKQNLRYGSFARYGLENQWRTSEGNEVIRASD
jgi:hypothetical protein